MQMRLKITINNKVHITIVQLKYHFLIQEIYILLANVLGMFMIKLVENRINMGNANSWATAAQAAGFTVNNTPEEGAIMQSSEGAFGHVAFVESVNNDGSITVSEMNYDGGPFAISTRTISASEASSYNYIHLN